MLKFCCKSSDNDQDMTSTSKKTKKENDAKCLVFGNYGFSKKSD